MTPPPHTQDARDASIPIHTCVDFSPKFLTSVNTLDGFWQNTSQILFFSVCDLAVEKLGFPAGLDNLAARKMPASVNWASRPEKWASLQLFASAAVFTLTGIFLAVRKSRLR